MRRTAIVLGFAALLFAAPVLATSLLTETFSYPDGGLVAVSSGNWTTHSGTGTDVQVAGLVAVGNPSNAPDDNRTFAAQGATSKTYWVGRVMIPTPSAAMTGWTYFAHFKDTGTSNFVGRLWALPSGSTFRFGVSVSSTNSTNYLTNVAQWTSDLQFDTWYIVVIDYDAAAGFSDMWVNPVNEASAKVTSNTTTGTATGVLVSAFAIRQGNGGTGLPSPTNWTFKLDSVGVGTTFEDAWGSSTVSIQPGTWGSVKALFR
jgi:hypothetical protein